jgi:transcription antitermination factor NusG
MPWFVIYTKSRSEKKVSIELAERGIEAYCPTIKKVKQWSDRKRVIEQPLFNSYVFVHLDERERAKVFGVTGFVRYLFWLQKPAIVKDEEIEAIRHFLNDFDHASITVVPLQQREYIRIKSGVLMDRVAEVVSQQGKKITLLLKELGFKVEIDLSETEVEKVIEN